MGTGNPGVSPERPRPVPLKTLTLGAGRGISRVRVRVWWGFKGIRVAPRVIVDLEDIIYKPNTNLLAVVAAISRLVSKPYLFRSGSRRTR
jgi:hypothetical protein